MLGNTTSITQRKINDACGENVDFVELWQRLLKSKEEHLDSTGLAGNAMSLARMAIRRSMKSGSGKL